MKTSNLLFAAVLVLGLAVVGCNKGNRVVVVTKSMPTAPVDLKLNWPVDRHGIQSMDMKMSSAIDTPWSPQPMNQEMTMGQQSSLTVRQESNGGNRDLELKYQSAKMSMTMNGKSMLTYDSSTSPANDTNPAAATLGKMIGAKVLFTLDASNHVESVQGLDELLQQMTSSPNADPGGMMKNMFSADALKRQIDFSEYLPGKPVQPGDTWPVQLDYPMGSMGTMTMAYTFTLTSWEKHHDRWCAKIDMDGTLTSKPGENPEIPGMKGMKMNMHDGTCSGETWFDLDLGMFVESTIYLDMKMDISMPNPMAKRTGGPATVTLHDTMHQAITTKFELQ